MSDMPGLLAFGLTFTYIRMVLFEGILIIIVFMEQLILDKAKTALVVIDLQKGIVGRTTQPYASPDVVKNAAMIAEACRISGVPVFLIRVTPSPDGKDALRPIADAPMPGGAPASDWADIVPEMGPRPGDFVLTKHQWGAFYGTELDLELRRRGVKTIILCGISTNIGVESTARDAYERGYDQVIAEDACAAMTAEEHAFSLAKIFPRIARVRKTADIIPALK